MFSFYHSGNLSASRNPANSAETDANGNLPQLKQMETGCPWSLAFGDQGL